MAVGLSGYVYAVRQAQVSRERPRPCLGFLRRVPGNATAGFAVPMRRHGSLKLSHQRPKPMTFGHRSGQP
jgi:hypothetical protein